MLYIWLTEMSHAVPHTQERCCQQCWHNLGGQDRQDITQIRTWIRMYLQFVPCMTYIFTIRTETRTQSTQTAHLNMQINVDVHHSRIDTLGAILQFWYNSCKALKPLLLFVSVPAYKPALPDRFRSSFRKVGKYSPATDSGNGKPICERRKW